MAFDELPPDPYKLLGVSKDAKLPEIRSAHRKLVLKCHPDKVQDATLKAIKQDEFQKVQQAYELLSDENRRLQYDEQVKLYALRKEMGRGNPNPRSNPFEYEVKTAEPRPSTFATHTYTRPPPKPMPRETTKVYPQQQRPNSYEDVAFEEPIKHPKKSASYESADRDRKSRPRDEDRTRELRRHEEDERTRQSKRAAHGEKKKRSDKDRKRSAEEKHSSRAAYVEEDSSDDYQAARPKEKARQERHRMEEEIRMRNEEAARESARKTEMSRGTPLTPKWDDHKEYAAQYMKAARRKAGPAAEEFHPRPMQRAETFAGPETKYNIRYAVPPQPAAPFIPSDDDTPRRSSAPRISRRTSETPPTSRGKDAPKSSSKEKEREKEKKKSARSRSRDNPYIVEPPSPPPPKQKPTLHTHSSAPPIIPGFPTRKEPSRSKTEYPRSKEAGVPPLPRAATFQSGDRVTDRATPRGSRLKKTVDYSSDSDSDSPVYTSNRHSHSPRPSSRRHEAPEPTRYIIDNGRSVPITSRASHRSEMRNIDGEVPYVARDRERSESPHGTPRHPRASERPPVSRAPGSGGTRQASARSHSQAYYPPPPEAPEPIIMNARPKMSPRESSHGHGRGSTRGSGGAPVPGGPYFGEVKYAAAYRPEDVVYNDVYRRGSDPTHHANAREYAYASPPSRGERIYA